MFKKLLLFSSLMFVACGKKSDAPADKPAADKPAAAKPTDKPADPSAAEAPTKTGCSYITAAEASEALGQPSKYRSEDDSENCVIDPVAEPSAETTSVDFTVKLGTTGGYDQWAKEPAMKPLAGVGDKALYDPSSKLMVVVAIVKGKDEVQLTFSGPKASDTAVIKAFADKVFKHL